MRRMTNGELSHKLFNVIGIAHKRLESIKILRTTEERDLRYKIPQPPKGRPVRSMEESIPLTPTAKKSSEISKESRFSQSNSKYHKIVIEIVHS